jgi:large subunit ribosomal protein L25
MAEDVVLTAEPRAERGSRPAGRLRRAGRVPGVVYGLGTDTQTVTVSARELGNILAKGTNTLITLKLDGDEALALARQVQRDPTRGDLVHVDFVRVSTDVAVAAEVGLHLTGDPEGVKSGGIVEQLIFTLPIEAKPQDIPTGIEHDISLLEIGDQLRVGELSLPPGVVATVEADALVAQVVAPRVVEEEVAAEEAEGEEGVEGEAAEGAAAEAPAEAATEGAEGGETAGE